MYIEPDDIQAILARGPDRNGEYQAAKILRKLLRAGLSRYEPRPLEALAAAKRAKAASTSTAPAAPTTTAPSTEDPEVETPVPGRRRA
jgi:hypothetical protein